VEELKERISEAWQNLIDQLEESSTYNTIKEKYLELSPNVQRIILVGGSLASVVIFLMIPLSYYSSSEVYTQEYEDNRQLLRELLKVQAGKSNAAPLPRGLNSTEFKNKARGSLDKFQLLNEQIGAIKDLSSTSPLAKPPVQQTGITVELKRLNLSQLVDIGYELQKLHQSVKMIGVEIFATPERDDYFNAIFKLVSFSFPQQESLSDSDSDSNSTSGVKPKFGTPSRSGKKFQMKNRRSRQRNSTKN
jgi:hypothetical protein